MHDASADSLIRIGIECESLEGDSWGVSRMVRKLAEGLAARPELARTHRFHLYFKSRIPDGPWLTSPLFVPTVTTPRGIPASFNLHYHVWMVARAYRDGVRALYLPAYQLPLLWFRASLVMLTEDIWREMRSPATPFRYRLSYVIFANWAARAASRVLAISRTSAAGISALFRIPPNRIAVNPLGVTPPGSGDARTVPSDVLFVGQAFPRRRLAETLDAFELLAADRPGLTLRAIGPDKYEPRRIARMTDAINRRLGYAAVRWDERVSEEDLAAAYRGARVAVYVSDAEAFGLPPLEALAHGVPPVVADAPVNREIYGGHAFYAATTDAAGIRAAVARALDDGPARDRIIAAAPVIVAQYTWQAHADRFLGIMDSLLR